MKFTRLRLVGFKSFCDATELNLEPGLSGVVGPNGCGKSNLVEAMRWVMGESSYKAMRAGGMDDVIFSGSGNRPARNSAEVTLVLDNSDRTAPAPLNTADELEVTRRIERESGSVYRVNGREVRARDVQLLFADASTGAHSPALVRQGQIGELIAARPQQRRALLEEAAGISGLHSRRHEAELRLRAAEQNLERVDDIVGQVEQQLETLKRQARLAIRYRGLSGDIRRAEATLYHMRWITARAAEKETEAEQGRATSLLAEARTLELEAQKVLFLAEQAVQPQRQAEAAAAASVQRLKLLGEQLAQEEQRIAARRDELAARILQLDADADRELALVAESAASLAVNAAERASLDSAIAQTIGGHEEAEAAAITAEAEADAAEKVSRGAHEALAALRARRAQAAQLVREANARVERNARQLADAERDLAALSQATTADAAVAAHTEALSDLRKGATVAEAAALAAEDASRAAQAAVDAARPTLQNLESGLKALETEAATIRRMLQRSTGSNLPGIVDSLAVTAGYETALGAALGDDLDAPADDSAPIRWTAPGDGEQDTPLPDGVLPLSRFVSGNPLLRRRLDQVGVIEAGDAPRLVPALRPGQMLVTLSGAAWRWDGLVADADAPSPAAEKLAQRNRLTEIGADIAARRTELQQQVDAAQALVDALGQARSTERELRDAWRTAQNRIGEAQSGLDSARRTLSEVTSRRAALEEARTRLAAGHAEALAMQQAAVSALSAAEDEADATARVASADAALAALRQRADQARLALGELASAARQREDRQRQLASDAAAWQRRHDGAHAQLTILAERRAGIIAERDSLTADPQTHAERRNAIADELQRATAAHRDATDTLAITETRHREADKAQRLAAEALSGAREQLARIEERLKSAIARRQQIEQLAEETLGVPARRTAELAGLRPQDALPDERQTEQRIERLKAERERLGGVNLSAEQESQEVRTRLDAMTKDRDDLIGAIATLRSAIQSLNREGRTRLAEAFDTVNAHFQELFTVLFGGGTAELRFVESDDPLEAGLEIIAKPPGKKPATMTLLSGGEQALTAMSLIFAVFLTNPAPICVLDEVDAPLDDANVERFCNLLDQMRKRTETRFLVITHNPITMSRVDRLFGVTMAERGVSQLVSVDLRQAESFSEAG